MKRHILTAAMLIVGSAAFAFDYQSNVGSFVASAVSTSNFDQFSWNWVGFNDQKIAVTSDIQVTKGGFRIVRQRDGAVMYEASEGTNSINSVVTTTNASTNYYLSLSIPRTNLPPNGTYLASFLAYEVTYTSVPTRVIADGKITIKYSPWEETNQSSYINPLAYTIIGPPGHTLTDATNWPFALTGTLDTVTGSIWTSLGTLSNKHDGLTSTYAVATGGLWTSLGTHTAQISALITTSATLTARAGSNEASIANLITTSGTHTVQIGTISNLAVVAQAYANTNLTNIAVLQTGAATYVALNTESGRIDEVVARTNDWNTASTDYVSKAQGGEFGGSIGVVAQNSYDPSITMTGKFVYANMGGGPYGCVGISVSAADNAGTFGPGTLLFGYDGAIVGGGDYLAWRVAGAPLLADLQYSTNYQGSNIVGTVTNSTHLGGVAAADYAVATGVPTLVQYVAWSNTVQTGKLDLATYTTGALASCGIYATGKVDHTYLATNNYTQTATDAAILQSETGGWRYATLALTTVKDQDTLVSNDTTNALGVAYQGGSQSGLRGYWFPYTGFVTKISWISAGDTSIVRCVVSGTSTNDTGENTGSGVPLWPHYTHHTNIAFPSNTAVEFYWVVRPGTNSCLLWSPVMVEIKYKP